MSQFREYRPPTPKSLDHQSSMTRQIPLLQRRGSEARGRNSSKGRRALHRTLPDARDERISKKELEDKICVEQRDVPLNASLRCTDYVNINEIINRRYVNVGPRTSIVGRGQFSRVYRMIDCTNGKLCAIKEINLRSASNKTQAGAELDFIMKMKSHRMSHQNIITFKHTLMSPTNVSIVMEYASLGSLQDLIDSSGASPVLSSSMDSNYVLPMEWISSIGKAIFSGLHFLHSEQNCTHGDVKPSNILLFKDGQIKLSDFGCCREIGKEDDSDGNGEESRSVCGTLAFMSPEQLLGSGPIGPESDVFSAGLTIMECIESSDQDRCGETFWDVVDVIEMRTKAVVVSSFSSARPFKYTFVHNMYQIRRISF